jgi:hypothetical protein
MVPLSLITSLKDKVSQVRQDWCKDQQEDLAGVQTPDALERK